MNRKEKSSVINMSLPEDINDDLQYFVDKYKGVTKRSYVVDALRNYNTLQKRIEKFKLNNPKVRFEIEVSLIPIDESDENVQKAAILVY